MTSLRVDSAEQIEKAIAAYIRHLSHWEEYSCPCFVYLPVLGLLCTEIHEEYMTSLYRAALKTTDQLHKRQLLDPFESLIWNRLKSSGKGMMSADLHWGRVKQEGLIHLLQIQIIARNIKGDYVHVLDELLEDIYLYMDQVAAFPRFVTPMCYTLPLIGWPYRTVKLYRLQRLLYKIWFTLEGLAIRGLMHCSDKARWDLMKDGESGMMAGDTGIDAFWGVQPSAPTGTAAEFKYADQDDDDDDDDVDGAAADEEKQVDSENHRAKSNQANSSMVDHQQQRTDKAGVSLPVDRTISKRSINIPKHTSNTSNSSSNSGNSPINQHAIPPRRLQLQQQFGLHVKIRQIEELVLHMKGYWTAQLIEKPTSLVVPTVPQEII